MVGPESPSQTEVQAEAHEPDLQTRLLSQVDCSNSNPPARSAMLDLDHPLNQNPSSPRPIIHPSLGLSPNSNSNSNSNSNNIPLPSPSSRPPPAPRQPLPQLVLPPRTNSLRTRPVDHPIHPFPRLAQPVSLPAPISSLPVDPNDHSHSHILINFFPPNSPLDLAALPKQQAPNHVHDPSPTLPSRYRTHSGVLEIRMPTLQPPGRPSSQAAASVRHPLHSSSRSNLANHSPRSPAPPPPLSAAHDRHLVFCCNGRLVSARPRQSLPLGRARALRVPFQTLGSLSLLIGLGTLFMALVAPFLAHQSGGGALLGVFVYCWLLCLSAMAKTVASDPGVLPRRLDPAPDTEWQPAQAETHPDANGDTEGEKAKLEVGEWALVPRWIKVEPSAASQLGATRYVEEQPSLADEMADERATEWVQSKWCNTCLSYRPPRSSHCRICDCCIDGIDHHCSYLNNCIGSRNYRSFFVFLLTSTINLILIICGTIWKLIDDSGKRKDGFGGAARQNAGELVTVILAVLLVVPIGALTAYHIFLTAKGLTTVEYIKLKTTRKVLKENSGLVEDFYGRAGLGKLRGGKMSGSRLHVIMGRLCRPDTERFVVGDPGGRSEEEQVVGEAEERGGR